MKTKKHVIIIRPSYAYHPMKGKALTLPFGALYLAERLIGDGFHVTIIDSDIKDATHAIDKSISSDTICVGISSMSGTQLGNAITIAKHIKSQYSDIPVVWGGFMLHLYKNKH